MAKRDELVNCSGKVLKPMGSFKYVGMTLQVMETTFMTHLREIAAAPRSISYIRHLQRMSVITASKLFRMKVKPKLMYGLKIIWNYLTKKHLEL